MTSSIDPGRPLKFESVAVLQQKIDEYFGDCDPHESEHRVIRNKANGEQYFATEKWLTPQIPYTVTGLALALDTTRQTLLDYESGKYDTEDITGELQQGFTDTIRKAKLKIHNYTEVRLHSGQIVSGPIFSLKNNFGWVDRQEVTGADGAPVNLGPEAAAVLKDALSEVHHVEPEAAADGSGADAGAVPEPSEPTGV